MFSHQLVIYALILVPLAIVVAYMDIRYRRIPNGLVLTALAFGIAINVATGALPGLLSSLGGLALAFTLMLVLHIFGAMGAGDVKLFAAIGSIMGTHLVLPTFAIILITGLFLAIYSMFRARITGVTLFRVGQFFLGFLPGWQMPRFSTTSVDRKHTVPYGVAITVGSIISLFIFRV